MLLKRLTTRQSPERIELAIAVLSAQPLMPEVAMLSMKARCKAR